VNPSYPDNIIPQEVRLFLSREVVALLDREAERRRMMGQLSRSRGVIINELVLKHLRPKGMPNDRQD